MSPGAGAPSGGAGIGTLVRLGIALRWRLTRNRLRKGGLALFVLVLVLCAVAAALGFLSFALGRFLDDDDARRALLTSSLTLLIVGWTFAPLLTGGADETVDPTRLALLPLGRRQLIAVLGGAAACGPATIAVLVALSGIVAGFAPAGPGAILVVLAVAVAFLLGLGIARLVASLLARAQRSRRGRDVAVLLTAGIGVTLWLGSQAIGPAIESGQVEMRGESVIDALEWLPPGWISRSILAASDGRIAAASAWLAAAAVLTVVALAGWSMMTDRLLRSSERVVGSRASSGVVLGAASTPFRAALAKELLYVRRSPFKRVQLILGTVMGGGFCAIQALNASRDQPRILFIALASPIFSLSGAYNLVGFDSGSIWLDQVTGGLRRAHLAARSLSWLPHVLLSPAVVTTAMAAWTGQWTVLPLVLLTAVGVAACGLGVGLVVSVRAPIPFQDGDNPFAWRSANSGGVVGGLYVLGGLIALCLVTAPFVVPVIIGYDSWWGYPVALGGVAFGSTLWWFALRNATRKLDGRTPALIAKLSPKSVV